MGHDTPPSTNPFAAHQYLLGERFQFLLTTLHPALQADVLLALKTSGKLLSSSRTGTHSSSHPSLPAGVWPLLTLLIAQYVSPDIDPIYASSVAVAVECFICALDLLDDIEDEDKTEIVQVLGTARTLNVSTTLIMLAQKAILSLSQQNIPPERILRLLNTLQETAVVATAGQHQDLLAEQRFATDLTEEECIEIAANKAGSLMRLACRLGAICAGADDFVCEHFSELGELLGIAHQLDNDAHDLYYLLQNDTSAVIPIDAEAAIGSVKTDLVRSKKTLPVVIAANKGGTLQSMLLAADKKNEEYLHALHEGIIATWGICLLYRERARDRLQEIEARQPVDPLLRLLLGL